MQICPTSLLSSSSKYLGVQITTSSASGIFTEATKACKQRLKSQAGLIFGLTKHDFNPIGNGLTLWSSMAVVSALYGAEVIHFKQEDIKELESIQGTFLAHLLAQRTSVSHAAVRNETGVKPISQIIMNMKLNYWYHLTKSAVDSWLRAAFRECFKLCHEPQTPCGWKLSFAKEIHDFQSKLKIPDPKTSKSKNIFKTTAPNSVPLQRVRLSQYRGAENSPIDGIPKIQKTGITP